MQKPTEPATTTSRRALFSAAAALPLAALPVVAIAAENPDAELLSAYHQIEIAEAEVNALAGDFAPGCDERMEAPLCIADAAYDRLEVLQAQTPAGLRAKANALRWAFERAVCKSPNGDGRTSIATINQDGEWHERLACSLARDVLAWRA